MIKIDDQRKLKSVEEVLKNAALDLSNYNINAKQTRKKGFLLRIDQNEVMLEYSDLVSLYNALLELSVNEEKTIIIEKEMFNSKLGIMLDCARNGAINFQAFKKFICIAALMGYNYVKLYVEDLMKLDGEDFFGYMRGAYSQEEFKQINDYAGSIGVEFVPCIQTLAHLNQIFRWKEYKAINDCEDILLVGEERTYELIEKMIKFCRDTTDSKRINIGMDEAEMVGLGKYLSKNGYRNRFEIMKEHLERVIEICKKYDFTPEIWSDMFFKIAFDGKYYVPYAEINGQIHDYIPQDLKLIYWDYYHKEEINYEDMLKNHRQLKKDVIYAGGIWTWRGFAPNNKLTEKTMFPALDACRKEKIDNIFFTMWADDGAECSRFSVIGSMLVLSQKCYDEDVDFNKISKMIEKITNYSYEDFLVLDQPNFIYNNGTPSCSNPSKFLLYNDLFISFFDDYVRDNIKEYYSKLADKLRILGKKNSPYNFLFENLSNLSKALSYKADLSKRIKEAYDSKDFQELELCAKDIKQAIIHIRKFYDSFKKQWLQENKAFGFEIHDARFGGLIFRLQNCLEVLVRYINHKIEAIDELNEARKSYKYDGNQLLVFNNYSENITSGKL